VIFVALALYRLFKGVDQNLAVLMVILGGLMPAAIYFFNVLNDAAALMLVRGADFLSVFEKSQRDALAMLFLNLHGQRFVAGELSFTGLLLPQYEEKVSNIAFPVLTGEVAFMLWLVIKGAKPQPLDAQLHCRRLVRLHSWRLSISRRLNRLRGAGTG